MDKGALSLYNAIVGDWIVTKSVPNVACCYKGGTIIHSAVCFFPNATGKDRAAVIKRLLDEGAPVEHYTVQRIHSPLANVVAMGELECARLLICRGAKATWCETHDKKFTVLSKARNAEMRHLLLDAGAARGIERKWLSDCDITCIRNRKRCSTAAISMYVVHRKRMRQGRGVADLLMKLVWETRTAFEWTIELESK